MLIYVILVQIIGARDTKMRFSARELFVAGAVQYRRSESITSTAKTLGLRTHELHYLLRRLQDAEILHPWVFVNPFTLGFEEYEILLTIGAAAKRTKNSFLQFLRSHPLVIWYGSLGGSFQYGIRLAAVQSRECTEFLNECSSRLGNSILRKSVVLLQQFSAFPKRYLAPSKHKLFGRGVTIAPPARNVTLSKLEYEVLRAYLKAPAASERELARLTGRSRTAVSRALDEMRTNGVIVKEAYLVRARKLGYQAYRILVYGKGLPRELSTRINTFAENHLSVVNMTSCLGEWEYELGIEVSPVTEATEIVSELYEECGDLITHLELLPIFEQNVSERFLDFAPRR